MRSLYVALTRATKLLTLVHRAPLPPVLAIGLATSVDGAVARAAESAASEPAGA